MGKIIGAILEWEFLSIGVAIILFLVRVILIPIFALILGFLFQPMWNYTMPVFGLPTLDYWRSVFFLVILSWVVPAQYQTIKVKEK